MFLRGCWAMAVLCGCWVIQTRAAVMKQGHTVLLRLQGLGTITQGWATGYSSAVSSCSCPALPTAQEPRRVTYIEENRWELGIDLAALRECRGMKTSI